ncbi:MAG: WG repeat-containing protein [Flavobacteriales bacterium]
MNRISNLFLLTLIINIGYAQRTNKVNAEYYLFDKQGKKITTALSYIEQFSDQGNAIFAIGGNYIESPYGKIPGAKYGIIHESGKIIVPAKYDYLESMYDIDSIFIASLDNQYGLITESGRTLVEPSYTELVLLYGSDNLFNAKSKNGSYQLLDLSGKILTKSYQFISASNSGFIIQSGGYQGLLDKNFKEIFPAIYENISELESGIFQITDKYQKQSLMSRDGKKLSNSYDLIEQEFDDNYSEIGYKVSNKEKDGFMDLNYQLIIPTRYNELSKISMGCNDYVFSYMDKGNKYGLLDQTGNKLGKAIYSSINSSSYFDKYLLVGIEKKTKKPRKKDSFDLYSEDYYSYTPSKYGLVDASGKMVLKAIYDDYNYSYGETVLIVLKKESNYVGLDANLTPVFKQDFSYIESLGDLFKVQLGGVDNGYGTPEGGVFGLYDKHGNEVIPVQYENISQIGYDNTEGYIIKRNGKYGLCSATGVVLMEPQYTEMSCESNVCIVSRYIEQSEQTKMGLIDRKALKEIVPTVYEHIESLSYEGDYLFKMNGKFGLMSSQGKIKLPASYTFLKATDLYGNDQLVLANAYGEVSQSYYGSEVTGGNWGVINKNGDTILPFKFKEISFENDSIVNLLDYDGKAYILNMVTQRILTNTEANYLSKINYDYENPIFLMGKDVTRGEYGDATGGTYGLVTLKGEELVPFNYSEISFENDHFVANSIDFNGYDLLNKKGTVLIKRASSIEPFSDSVFLVQMDGKASLYNVNTGQYSLASNYTDFATPEYYSSYGPMFVGIKNTKDQWGVLNKQGETLIEPQYCDVMSSTDGYVIVAKCGAAGEAFKYGVVDLMNNVVIPFEYESIESVYYANTYECVKGSTRYTINLSNEVINKNPVSTE